MNTASIHDVKQELASYTAPELAELCIRLAKFKKENKELLNYLLFESHDLHAYIELAKNEMTAAFEDMPVSNVYFTKKRLRKILTQLGKQIKYTASKEAAIELLLHFCTLLKASKVPVQKHQVLINMQNQQWKKINTLVGQLHEDLQYDYQRRIEELQA